MDFTEGPEPRSYVEGHDSFNETFVKGSQDFSYRKATVGLECEFTSDLLLFQLLTVTNLSLTLILA